MWPLVILIALYVTFHVLLILPIVAAIVGALVVYAGLWILWKLRYFILAIVGLEILLGGGDN